MALSFLYMAFVRVLQMLRLRRCDHHELAVEVVVLRHEIMILRRQVERPALRPADRAVLAGLGRLVSKAGRVRFFVQPETLLRWHRGLVRRRWTHPQRGRSGRPALSKGSARWGCSAGIEAWSVADGRILSEAVRDGQHCPRERCSWYCAWPGRTLTGAIEGSTVSWPRWAWYSHLRASGRSCAVMVSTHRRGALVRRGQSSRVPRRRRYWPVTSSTSTRCCSAGSTCSSSSRPTLDASM